MIEPVEAAVSQEWGLTRFARDNPHVYPGGLGHRGRDYASFEGTPVVAPEDGVVAHVGETTIWAWGYVVSIDAGGSPLTPTLSLGGEREPEIGGERERDRGEGELTTGGEREPDGGEREPGHPDALPSGGRDYERRHHLCHLQQDSAYVVVGDVVKAGDEIARSGRTPNWPPHLHWEIRGGGPGAMGGSIDPRTLLHPDRYGKPTLREYARIAAKRAGIDPELFDRQIERESSWDMYALSAAGAVGLAQIVPRWHPTVNPWDPHAALDYAAGLMADHLGEFGSYELALAAYNAGPNAVRRHGGVPPFEETRDYVNRILGETKVRPARTVHDDPDFWLKSKWEELAQAAIQVVNRAGAGAKPTADESRFLNHRYKELMESWPRLMEAERERSEGARG